MCRDIEPVLTTPLMVPGLGHAPPGQLSQSVYPTVKLRFHTDADRK